MFSQSPGYDEISDEEAAQFEKPRKMTIAWFFTCLIMVAGIAIAVVS